MFWSFFHEYLQGVVRCALCCYYSSRWFAFVEFVLLHSMWPHVYVICACLVFLSVGDLLVNTSIFPLLFTKQCSLVFIEICKLSTITTIRHLTLCFNTICLYLYQISNIPSNFFHSCADLLLLWDENCYRTWPLRGTLRVFCNMHNKNIYNEYWQTVYVWFHLLIEWYDKIQYNKETSSFQQGFLKKSPAARQQFRGRGAISLTARPRILAT
jgi:hypothetical protein